MEPPVTHRICLTVHYDGGAFHGWQLQPTERSVQGELERVLERLFTRPVRVIGSGRTDRGVHATGQVVAVDAPVRWEPAELMRGLNALLSADVHVTDARLAAPHFHPRYGALSRSYLYRIGGVPEAHSPFHARWCWAIDEALDRDAMAEAATTIAGDHSFRAFAKAGQEHRGDRCIVTNAHWASWDGMGLEFHISANRFLHHMVRYLVGTLVEVGLGRREPGVLGRLIAGDPALRTSPPAPARGLFLRAVHYPDDCFPVGGPPPIPSGLDLP